ncbi:MAG: translocation/assembly module TamB [Spirochaetales bacterium]|jgi:hypothetical protein|nr:translocation/assembly module TamB [Spirochaetales bacterium]
MVKYLLISLGCLGLTAALLLLANRTVISRVDILRDSLLVRLEAAAGYRIQVGSLSPSLLRGLEIRNLRILDSGDGEILSFSLLRVSYSLFKLFGKRPLSALTRISVDNSYFRFDPEKETALIDLFQRFQTSSSGGFDPADLEGVEFTGRNLNFALVYQGREFSLSRAFFSLRSRENQFEFSLRGNLAALEGQAEGFRTDVQLSGLLAPGGRRGEAVFALTHLASSYLDSGSLSFQMAWEDKEITLRKNRDRLPFDLSLSYDLDRRTGVFDFAADKFIPSNYFHFGPALDQAAQWMNLSLSGDLEGRFDLEGGDLDYRGNLNLTLPRNRVLPLPMSLEAVFSGNRDSADFTRLRVRTRRGSLGFTGRVDMNHLFPTPTGWLTLEDVEAGGRKFSGNFRLSQQGQDYILSARSLDYGALRLGETSLTLHFRGNDTLELSFSCRSEVDWENRLTLEASLLLGRDSPLGVPGFRFFTWPARGAPRVSAGTLNRSLLGREPFLECRGEIQDFPLSGLGALLLPDFTGLWREELCLGGEGFFSSNFSQFSFSLSNLKLQDHGAPDRYLRVSLSGNESALAFRSLEAAWGARKLTGTGEASWDKTGRTNLALGLQYRDQPYQIGGVFIPGKTLHLTGQGGLEGAVFFDSGGLNFTLRTEELPLPQERGLLYLSLNCRGGFPSSGGGAVFLNRSRISGLPSLTGEARDASLTLSGRFTEGDSLIYDLVYEDSFSPLRGEGSFSYDISASQPNLSGWIQFTGPGNGQEAHTLRVLCRDGGIEAELASANLPLQRLGTLPVEGFLTSRITLSGELKDPDISLNLDLRQGQFLGRPLSLGIGLTLLPETAAFHRFQGEWGVQRFWLTSGSWVFDQGKLALAGRGEGRFQNGPVSADFKLDLNSRPLSGKWDLGRVFREDFQGNVGLSDIALNGKRINPWDIVFIRNGEDLRLRGGPEDSLLGSLKRDSEFSLSLSSRLPVSFNARGRILQGNIEAELTQILIDFERVSEFWTIPVLNLRRGQARGNLSLSGLLQDPDIFGSLACTGLQARLNILDTPLIIQETLIRAEQKSFYLEQAVVQAEQGRALMDGEIVLDHFAPLSYELHLKTIEREDPFLQFQFPGINLGGQVQGSLDVEGDSTAILLKGDILLHTAAVTLNNVERQSRGPGRLDMQIDLTLNLGNNITFYWPNQDTPVIRAYARGNEALAINYDTGNESFSIRGRVSLRGGEIVFINRNFYLQEGALILNETQDQFDPLLNARALIREVDPNGQLIRIYLVAENMSLFRFNPRFESDPPRSSQDIMAMLGGGLLQDSGEEGFSYRPVINIAADFLSNLAVFRRFENTVARYLGLDVFSVRSQLVPNLILGRMEPSATTLNVQESGITRYLDNTTLFGGKYFGDFFLQGILQMDYYGATQEGLRYASRFNMDVEIVLEWDSPLAKIEFGLYPNFTDPEKHPLSTSLSLSWSFSY